jgi:hypothetical protein
MIDSLNVLLKIKNRIIDKIMYTRVNFIPSRYALDVTFFPNIIVEISKEINGIIILIKLVLLGDR